MRKSLEPRTQSWKPGMKSQVGQETETQIDETNDISKKTKTSRGKSLEPKDKN